MSGFGAVSLPQGTGLGLAMAGQAASAFGQASASRIQGNAQAAAFDYNASIERDRQDQIADAGKDDERRIRRLARLTQGRNRAAIGGSGLALEGQRVDILREDAVRAELDVLQLRENTAREIEASRKQEVIDRFQARQSKKMGKIGARDSLLTGVLGAANTYATLRG